MNEDGDTQKKGLQRLEANIDGSSEPKYVGDLKALHWHDRHVCRIEVEEPNRTIPRGTGFLVAEDLVLTNYHVIEDDVSVEEEGESLVPQKISCRFDVQRVGVNDFSSRDPVKVTNILSHSQYSELEKLGRYTGSSVEHPSHEDLDYALLQLEKPVAFDLITNLDGSRVRRRWIDFPQKSPKLNNESDVYILQHPSGDPLRSAIGPILNNPVSSRIRYGTNTEGGSSGSPCFRWGAGPNPSLHLVALHNYGDPSWFDGQRREPEFNHGIPITLIRHDLTEKELWPLSSLSWRLKHEGLKAIRWFFWPSIRISGRLPDRLFSHIRAWVWLIIVLLIAGSGYIAYGWWDHPKLPVKATRYAYFVQTDKNDHSTGAGLILRLKILPNSDHLFYVEDIVAAVQLGNKSFPMSKPHLILVKNNCLNTNSCQKVAFQSFKLNTSRIFSEYIIFNAKNGEFGKLRWILLNKSLSENESIKFLYSVFYRSQSEVNKDRPSRSISFECSASKPTDNELETDNRFRWRVSCQPYSGRVSG